MFKVWRWTIENKLKSINNKDFHYNTIRQALANPVYCVADLNFYNYAKENNMIICNSKEEFESNKIKGVMCYNKSDKTTKKKFREKNEWIVAIGQHNALIDSKSWIKVQKMKNENALKFPALGTSQEALLSGLLHCKNCGGTFRVIALYRNHKRTQHYYYKCKNKAASNGLLCNIKNINGQEADNQIIEFLKQLKANPKAIDTLYNKHENEINIGNVFDEVKKIERLIEQNENKIDKLTDELIEDSVSSKYIKRKIEKLDTEIKEANKKITELKSKQNKYKINEMNAEIFKNQNDKFIENLDNLSIEEQRIAIKHLIKEIVWDGENLHITPRL